MALKLDALSLTDEEKALIVGTEFQLEKGRVKKFSVDIQPWYVDEAEKQVYVPFFWGVSELGRKSPPRAEYAPIAVEFQLALRDYQEDILPEVRGYLNRYGAVLLSLNTGWGKSLFATYLACRVSLRVLIVVNKLMLVPQWQEEIRVATGREAVFLRPGCKKVSTDAEFYLINAENIPKFQLSSFRFGTVIVDELHLVCAEKLFTNLLRLTPKYLLGLSATPYRNDALNRVIELIFGKLEVNGIERKLERKFQVHVYQTKLIPETRMSLDGSLDWNSVLEWQANSQERNALIVNLLLQHSERKWLVLVKRIAHGRVLADLLSSRLGSNTGIHLILGEDNTFSEVEAPEEGFRVLFATSQKCGTGFSFKHLDALMVATDLEAYFIQYLGRVFRTPKVQPLVVELVDSLPTLKKHFSTRSKIYKETGGFIVRVKQEL